VRVLDDTTIVFPNYDGNGMFLSIGNARINPHVGLLFMDFQSPRRLRLNGAASIAPATAIEPQYPEAQFVVRIKVRELFPNCPRYIHQYQLIERSRFVPRTGVATPTPAWKEFDWARDVLADRAPFSGWLSSFSVVQGAAFHRYSRGASDYEP
jgi:hypothetical protein